MSRKKRKVQSLEEHLDLVPMIDCVFLLILFFVLCGKISLDQRATQIAVPPTITAAKQKDPDDWKRLVVTVRGTTRLGKDPLMEIQMGPRTWTARGTSASATKESMEAYAQLRSALNVEYDQARDQDDQPSTLPPGVKLKKIIVELRADSNAEYRVIQEVQQVISDTLIPYQQKDGKELFMHPRGPDTIAQMKPFNVVDFTATKLGDKR